MRIAMISDLHGHLPHIEGADLLLIAGDVTPATNHKIDFQKNWLDTVFRNWLKNLPIKHKVFCFGNHDFFGEERPEEAKRMFADYPAVYLENNSCEIEGLKIYGSPETIEFYDWAYNRTKEQLKVRWNEIPEDTDILMTHQPPWGCGDTVFEKGNPINAGCYYLQQRIQSLKLKVACFGHLHEGYGEYRIGDTPVFNVSYLNDRYVPTNEPFFFDI